MRRFLYIAVVPVSALALAASIAPAEAAAGHVLATGKAGGTAVNKGALLKAGLAKGTSAVFSIGTERLTCTSSSFTAKVTSNPAAHGTARESITAQYFAKVSGISVQSVRPINLPYNAAVSDSKGDPVKVSGRSKSKPLGVAVTVKAGTLVITCSYRASLTAHASNKGNVISISKQKFTRSAGGSLCPASALFSATYGPVQDSSVKGSPKVFVN